MFFGCNNIIIIQFSLKSFDREITELNFKTYLMKHICHIHLYLMDKMDGFEIVLVCSPILSFFIDQSSGRRCRAYQSIRNQEPFFYHPSITFKNVRAQITFTYFARAFLKVLPKFTY